MIDDIVDFDFSLKVRACILRDTCRHMEKATSEEERAKIRQGYAETMGWFDTLQTAKMPQHMPMPVEGELTWLDHYCLMHGLPTPGLWLNIWYFRDPEEVMNIMRNDEEKKHAHAEKAFTEHNDI